MESTVADYGVTDAQREAWKDLNAAYDRYIAVVRERQPEPVEDLELSDASGATVHLSDLFDGREDLLVIHNMGAGCSYCTMWADGLNGLLPHLEDRAAVAFVSPDSPDAQRTIAQARGWNFRMFSNEGHDFTQRLGFARGDDMMPGFSAFHREADGTIVRTSSDGFGPGDLYNAAWPMFEHLAGGAGEWTPQQRYSQQ